MPSEEAFMSARCIRTRAGDLELTPATIEQVERIAQYWPMGIVGNSEQPGLYGLVFQNGAEEVHGVKVQPPDLPAKDALLVHHINRSLIAAAIPAYVAKGHRGVIVPCAYYKEKGKGLAESGIAFFAGPDVSSHSESAKDENVFDERLGKGATTMILDMFRAIAAASRACRMPFQPVIGMEMRPRLAIGGIVFYFAIEGSRTLMVKDPVDDADPVWETLVRAGVQQLPHAPMKPVALSAES